MTVNSRARLVYTARSKMDRDALRGEKFIPKAGCEDACWRGKGRLTKFKDSLSYGLKPKQKR